MPLHYKTTFSNGRPSSKVSKELHGKEDSLNWNLISPNNTQIKLQTLYLSLRCSTRTFTKTAEFALTVIFHLILVLQNQWSPVYDVWAILTSLRSLLSDPNPLSPANSVAAQMYNENRSEYERRVR